MNITVILCTHNRSASLAEALESLAASILPASISWEVLVVDNNSSDQTRQVVEDISRRHPSHFRYLFEPRPGKSYALNAGIQESRGDVLAFIDDDVTVEPAWLRNLTVNLQSGEWAGAGGRILPARPLSPPRWLALDGPYSLAGILYAHFDLGDAPRELNHAPYGTNMAFQKRMFEKYGVFRTDLGPSPDTEIPRPGEDTEFGRRLMAAGEHLRYEPSAVVYHAVSESRIRKEYFQDWWFDHGRAIIREGEKQPGSENSPRNVPTIPVAVWRMLSAAFRWMRAVNPQCRFYRKCWVWVWAGQIAELYRLSRGARGCRTTSCER
jgi:glucosyl-dolichyl phosphate glucuronosyltransferase